MPDDGNIFSADINELLNGAPKIEHFSTIMGDIYGNLFNTLEQNPLDDSGGDDTSKALKKNYDPAKVDCLDFLRNLKELSLNHSQNLGNLGNLFDNMNQNNTDQAGGLGGHRH
jgi:hypothetical protein